VGVHVDEAREPGVPAQIYDRRSGRHGGVASSHFRDAIVLDDDDRVAVDFATRVDVSAESYRRDLRLGARGETQEQREASHGTPI
jgi:hypothetical protein